MNKLSNEYKKEIQSIFGEIYEDYIKTKLIGKLDSSFKNLQEKNKNFLKENLDKHKENIENLYTLQKDTKDDLLSKSEEYKNEIQIKLEEISNAFKINQNNVIEKIKKFVSEQKELTNNQLNKIDSLYERLAKCRNKSNKIIYILFSLLAIINIAQTIFIMLH